MAEAAASGTLSATSSNSTASAADALGLPLDTTIKGQYVAKVTVTATSATAATITAKFGTTNVPADISGKTVIWAATVNLGSVTWKVDSVNSTVPGKYLPKA
ncbi:MAG: pilin [Candidatus Methylopumilus sp.]